MVARRFLLLVGLLMGAAGAAQSQSLPDSATKAPAARDSSAAPDISHDSVSAWQTSFWGGVARGSSSWGILGTSYGMNFGELAVRFSRPRSRRAPGRPEWAWTVDLIPLAMISPPSVSDPTKKCPSGNVCLKPDKPGTATNAWFPTGSVRGLGVAPLGVSALLKPESGVSPTIGLSGGALYFEEPVPSTGGSRFNFTASLELGVLISPVNLPRFAVQYKFQHISNAGSAENLGVASHLLTFAISRGKAHRAG